MCVSGMGGPRALKNKSSPCLKPLPKAEVMGRNHSDVGELGTPTWQIPKSHRGLWLLEPVGSFRGEGGKGMLRAGKIALAPKA